jgi:Serine carboxypeptidase S28
LVGVDFLSVKVHKLISISDHFGSNTDTFENRYWVNDEFWKPGGPVFVFDAGEGNAEPYISLLTFGPANESSNALPDLAQRFGAYVIPYSGRFSLLTLASLFILWEHRYYGQSLPAQNVNGNATLDDVASYYQYLTFEQALEDVAVFAKSFSLASHPDTDFRPNKLPWVFIGGSYPGVRAAWMRIRNPEVIYASLSSSAPVQLQEDFWQYWVAVER